MTQTTYKLNLGKYFLPNGLNLLKSTIKKVPRDIPCETAGFWKNGLKNKSICKSQK